MERLRRSTCPISYALDLFGDRWTLLVLRDMVFGRRHYFSAFLESGEGIATNILTDRLARLEQEDIIRKTLDPEDRRRRVYSLTDRGLDVLPVLLELIVWGASHDPHTPVTPEFLRRVREERDDVIRSYRSYVSSPANRSSR
jgi:DNA-binding HxlR family transcriptional regulator